MFIAALCGAAAWTAEVNIGCWSRGVGKPGFPTPPPRRGMGKPGFPIPPPGGRATPSQELFSSRRCAAQPHGRLRRTTQRVSEDCTIIRRCAPLRALRCVASGRRRLFVLQIPRCARPWAGRRCPRPAIAPPCSLSPAPLTRIRAWCGSKTPTSSSPSVLAPRSRRSPGSASRCGSRQPAGDLRARAGPGSAIMGLFL